VQNIPQEAMQPLILIECPRLLFPFARQIVSEVTQSGGFPPLLVDPVDFARLYQERFMSGQGQSPNVQAN
jgi:preprotein translocase subunit SecB